MNSEKNGKPIKYRLDMSGVIAESIKQLKKDGDLEPNQDVRQSLWKIMKRLQSDPLNFGELIGIYHKLNLIMHVAVVPPLLVRFAIHQEAKIVIIMKISRLSKS